MWMMISSEDRPHSDFFVQKGYKTFGKAKKISGDIRKFIFYSSFIGNRIQET